MCPFAKLMQLVCLSQIQTIGSYHQISLWSVDSDLYSPLDNVHENMNSSRYHSDQSVYGHCKIREAGLIVGLN